MNQHNSFTLTSRLETRPHARKWASLVQSALTIASLLGDIVTIITMSYLTRILYHRLAYGDPGDSMTFINLGIVTAGLFVIPRLVRGEYKIAAFFEFDPHIRRAFMTWNVTFICLLAIAFFTKVSIEYSRGWILLFFISGFPPLILLRYIFVRATASANSAGLVFAQRVFLVGSGQHVGDFINRYHPWSLGISVVGCRFLTPTSRDASDRERQENLDRDLVEATNSARDLEPDSIFLVVPWSATELINRCADRFMSLPVEIHLAPETIFQRFKRVRLSTRGTMSSLQLTRVPLSKLEIIEKRVFDLVFAGFALFALTPLLVIVAAAIKIDSSGPAFFLQRRYGFNQRQFRIIKFRTMNTLDDGENVRQATRNDPRVTRLGRWLRRWNIDEIPQLFNVLLGDMSLVGPRPHALSHDHEYERIISLYARRHNVKPGITGWAQVNGFRGETTPEKMRKRVEHDLHYIDNWSIWFDFVILVRTALSPVAYRNAY